MIFLGVDPGLRGAFALLTLCSAGTDLRVLGTPTVRLGSKRRYDLAVLEHQLATLPPITLACLEAQSARPGQGVTSMFSIGYGAGMWEALLVAHQIPFVLVRPQNWRGLVGVPSFPTGTPTLTIKRSVKMAAMRRFPTTKITLDHADAVMLAVAASLRSPAVHRRIA